VRPRARPEGSATGRGFQPAGLRVGSKTKTFIAEGQVRRRTVRVSLGRYPRVSPEVARRLALQHLSDMAQGLDAGLVAQAERSQRITVAEAFDKFFAEKTSLRPATIQAYRRTPKTYLADWLSLPIREVTREMVLQRHRRIATNSGGPTANSVFRHLRSVYNFVASLNDDFPPNPVGILSRTRAWRPERRRQTVVAPHQLPAWWSAIMSEREDARDFLLVAMFTGMRRGEIAGLRWDNIDLIGRTLLVPRTKNGDPLVLPLSTFLAELFAGRRAAVGLSEWVFPGKGRTGHLAETKSFTRRVCTASGVRFTLHDLRRTFITIAESLDIPAYALKRLLNHRADGDVTGGYIVMDVERLRGPVERIATRIRELADGPAK
jgi:integrase